ncbi:Uncharacterised protein [uncultured archaeon]|nr:Uncharacterised protein [uncultured archaeon]
MTGVIEKFQIWVLPVTLILFPIEVFLFFMGINGIVRFREIIRLL